MRSPGAAPLSTSCHACFCPCNFLSLLRRCGIGLCPFHELVCDLLPKRLFGRAAAKGPSYHMVTTHAKLREFFILFHFSDLQRLQVDQITTCDSSKQTKFLLYLEGYLCDSITTTKKKSYKRVHLHAHTLPLFACLSACLSWQITRACERVCCACTARALHLPVRAFLVFARALCLAFGQHVQLQ